MIHEGTHGIQALDLLGRKVVMKNGAALNLLSREIDATIALAMDAPLLRAHAMQLQDAWADIVTSVERLKPTLASDAEAALANASLFLEAFGHAVLAWSWLKQAVVADAALPAACGGADEPFYRGKLQACQYFFRWELPRIGAQLTLLRSLDQTTRHMQPDWF
jgi:hypothetical protein